MVSETYTGSRGVKPRAMLRMGPRNRVTGAVRYRPRPDEEAEEDEVGEQLSLLSDA